MHRFYVAAIVALVPTASSAQLSNNPAQRRAFVPYIRAATKCVADETIKERAIRDIRMKEDLEPIIRDVLPRCRFEVERMIANGNCIYGFGGGQEFFEGPYTADLPRAVFQILKPRLAIRQAEIATEEENERQRQQRTNLDRRDQEARDAESRRIERERQETEERRKLDEEKLRALDSKRERDRKIDDARRLVDLLRDKAYGCITGKIKEFVKSGESADIVVNAAITTCDDKVGAVITAGLELYPIEQGVSMSYDDVEKFKAAAKRRLKEKALAFAVQVKSENNSR